MLRYETETRHGLVALYDIRPGNGAGPFLQHRSPHGACTIDNTLHRQHSGNALTFSTFGQVRIIICWHVKYTFYSKCSAMVQTDNTTRQQ